MWPTLYYGLDQIFSNVKNGVKAMIIFLKKQEKFRIQVID